MLRVACAAHVKPGGSAGGAGPAPSRRVSLPLECVPPCQPPPCQPPPHLRRRHHTLHSVRHLLLCGGGAAQRRLRGGLGQAAPLLGRRLGGAGGLACHLLAGAGSGARRLMGGAQGLARALGGGAAQLPRALLRGGAQLGGALLGSAAQLGGALGGGAVRFAHQASAQARGAPGALGGGLRVCDGGEQVSV